jgi:AbrB family looped-hinge helix DNA binding protein
MLTTIVGERGQITIPKEYRKRLGILPKSPVEIEMTSNGLLIRPTITVPLRSFTQDFIDEIVAADTLEQGESEKILKDWSR